MNKNRIGLYTEDEIFDYMTNYDEGSMLGRSMYDNIFEKIHMQEEENANLKQVLARIREYCEQINTLFWVEDNEPRYVSKDILQIIDKVGCNNEKD